MKPLRVLLLEDSPLDAELIDATLAEGGVACSTVRVQTEEEFLNALNCDCPDLILADYSLPQFDGYSALRIASQQCPDVPFLFVSGAIGEERAIEALKNGATDYVLKHRLGRLVPAVTRAVREAEERNQRRLFEEALAKSEERFRAIFNQVNVGVAETDLTGRYVLVNQRFCDIVGLPREEVLDRHFQELTHPDDLEENLRRFNRMIETGKRFVLEKRYVRPNGKGPVWVRNAVSVVRDRVGRPVYAVSVVEDITNQRKLEADLRRHVEELNEAARQKDEFVAMLSHELRNPLAPIRNGLRLLKMSDPATPAFVEARAVLDRQFTHLARLVDDLMEVFQASHGGVALRPERLDLNELAARVAGDYAATVEQAGLRLVVEPAAEPVWVRGDEVRLMQVITNLLDNAIKFTERGGTVTVQIKAAPALAELVFRDTGVGIDPAMLPRIFEVFTQLDPGYDRRRGGLGLGLALVKKLIELQGGTVEAASEGPGKGAQFTIRLPYHEQPAAPVSPDPDAGQANSRQLRVLVVEDNRDSARTLELLLQQFGHLTQTAHTGPDGVEAADRFDPDVVLCDLGLPGLDGFEVARRLRVRPEKTHVRLIAVSGFSEETTKQRAQEAGFEMFLTKPLDPDDLVQVLTSL